MMTETELAYAAGILDGEGSVMLSLRAGKKQLPNIVLVVTVANTNLPLLSWFKERWNGSVSVQARLHPRKPCGYWKVRTSQAARFLSDVLPYIRVKRPQIENALAFQATKRSYRSQRSRMTADDWAKAQAYLATQHELNRRGAVGGQ